MGIKDKTGGMFGLSTNAIVVIVLFAVVVSIILFTDIGREAAVTTPTAPPVAAVVNANLGEQSTLTIRAVDTAGDSSADVTNGVGLAIYADVNGADGEKFVDIHGANTGSTHTSNVVGDVVNIYGANYSDDWYCTPIKGLQLTREQQTVEMTCNNIAAEGNLVTTVFDKDDNEITTATNISDFWNYNMTLGASQQERLKIRLQNNEANANYNLFAFCTGAVNDIDDLTLQDSGWTKVAVPENVSKSQITGVSAEYDKCFERSDGLPIVLEEFDIHEIIFVIEAGTTDPATAIGDSTTADVAWIQFYDGMPTEGKDGKMTFGFFQKDDNEETRGGVVENSVSATGKTSGAVIAVI